MTTGTQPVPPPPRAVEPARVVIEVEDLEKRFRARGRVVEAVAGLGFTVAEGEVFGLLGPNGAGKTTTMRMLTTLLPIDAGRAVVAGVDVASHPAEVRRHLGYVSQAGGADTLATGWENLFLQGALYGMGRGELAARVPEVLELLDLAELAERRVKTYSGGQRRRLDVALGIVHRPEVLFLDEPSTGLDPQNRANLWDHVRALAASGTTVVLTTHYLEEADQLCDRVVIVDHGRIVAAGTPAALKAEVAGATAALGVADPAARAQAAEIIGEAPGVGELAVVDEELRVRVTGGTAVVPDLLEALGAHGIAVSSLSIAEPSLDDVFLAATGRSLR
ncbi:MAG: ATP-binding cassette domain-containing protein, partial [Actinomycetota bacterium]|nr:ATP-binding cassette domain-containing protein [Actinomycetota bacterium]